MCILRLIYGKKVCGEMGKCKERGFSCYKNIHWVTIICEHSTSKLFQILEATEVGECYTALLARLYNVWGRVVYSICLPTKAATIILKHHKMCSSPWETKFEWPVWTKNIFLVIDPAGPSGPCLLGEMSRAVVSTWDSSLYLPFTASHCHQPGPGWTGGSQGWLKFDEN